MKRPFSLLIFLVMAYCSAFSQGQLLLDEIELVKKQAGVEGFTLLDEGGFMTSNDTWIHFDQESFFDGYTYSVVAFIEECYSCEIGVAFKDASSGEVGYFEPDTERAGNMVRGIVSVDQEGYAEGTLYVFSKTTFEHYTYAMLFRRPR